MKDYSLTKDQRQTLDRDLATITESLENTASPLRVCYGDEDRLVYRSDEASAAVQRLLWAMERQGSGRNKLQLNLIAQAVLMHLCRCVPAFTGLPVSHRIA